MLLRDSICCFTALVYWKPHLLSAAPGGRLGVVEEEHNNCSRPRPLAFTTDGVAGSGRIAVVINSSELQLLFIAIRLSD